jgi:hypothetical protein
LTAAEAGEDGYSMNGGLLQHLSCDEWGEDRNQVAVPHQYRQEVIALAHRPKTSGHLGSKKTTKRILRHFNWPRLSGDVRAHCQSCEEYQRGTKGSTSHAPLKPLPAIEEPFRAFQEPMDFPTCANSKEGWRHQTLRGLQEIE